MVGGTSLLADSSFGAATLWEDIAGRLDESLRTSLSTLDGQLRTFDYDDALATPRGTHGTRRLTKPERTERVIPERAG